MKFHPKLKRYIVPALATVMVGAGALIYRAELTAWFTGKPLPTSQSANGSNQHAPASGFISAGDYQVAVSVEPQTPQVGSNTLEINVIDAGGEPVDNLDVSAVAIMPAMGAMPEMRAGSKIQSAGEGHYHGDFELSMVGAWPLTLTLKTAGGEETKLYFDMATTTAGLQLTSSTPASGKVSNGSNSTAINDVCPILGDKVPADAKTVTWNGNTIGFCCPPCEDDWNKLSDEKKQAFVDRFKDRAIGSAGDQPVNRLCPVLGNPVETDGGSTKWNGHTVGFCCPPCEDDWNKFSEEKKQAFVDRALKEPKPVAGESMAEKRPPPPEGEIAFHTCSMHPSVKSKDPGTCPICKMDLTPVTHEEVRDGIIFVDSKRKQLIGVTTTTAMEQTFDKEIRAVGTVTYDETRLADVTLKVEGWIGDIHADYTGKKVVEGEALFTVYSPEILSVQQDLIDSKRANGRGLRLVESARERLRLLDLTESQIDDIAANGKPLHYVPILSPASGTVIEKTAVKGSSIPAGKTIYRIADLSSVWVEVDVYESDLPLMSEGLKASLTLPYLPGKTIEGEISYIYPYLDAKTRTGRVRIIVPNPDGALKPDMFVEAKMHVPLGKRLAVPEDAILYAGESNVVFLDLGEGRMRPQNIKIGVRAGDLVEVIDGLKAGDTVVSSGNFLVASESKLKSGKDKW